MSACVCSEISCYCAGLCVFINIDSKHYCACSCMLMSHFEEPKLSDDEEPPTEQDKRKKLVRQTQTHTKIILQA